MSAMLKVPSKIGELVVRRCFCCPGQFGLTDKITRQTPAMWPLFTLARQRTACHELPRQREGSDPTQLYL